jgi:L,D-transpeptidase YcbB
MTATKTSTFFIANFFIMILLSACNSATEHTAKKETIVNKDITSKPTSETIKKLLENGLENNGQINKHEKLYLNKMVHAFYNDNAFVYLWSKDKKWSAIADTVLNFIKNAELYGLFTTDYHATTLQIITKNIATDSVKRKDENVWSLADVLLTDAYMHIIKDVKYGRLFNDSLLIADANNDKHKFVLHTTTELFNNTNFSTIIQKLAPKNKGYANLQAGLKLFVDSMDRKPYTYISYPFKRGEQADSFAFINQLQQRLFESNCIEFVTPMADSTQLGAAIKCYQKKKGLQVDGKYGNTLIKQMNLTDIEKFKRIAITLDRYKLLPDSLPKQYIWVNLPSYYLHIIDSDTIALTSKIICGKPDTRTPLLSSKITDMVIYPTWTVPNSIITKQYLPKLKKNPNYLNRLGLKLKNNKGQIVDAGTINWDKYNKGIPYKVMQNSGDNNALGIMKFNFNNEYAVYLHDTNQRYLFKNTARALSHGCVRVQEWEKLAFYLARNDSALLKTGDSLNYNVDSIKQWLADKKYKRIDVKNQFQLYINYFSCEGINGKIKFYDDIYGEDKALREKYFSKN